MEMGGEGEHVYLSLLCYHQNGSCIKVGSDEIHFHIQFINCDGQSHKTVSTNHKPFEEKGEPKRYRTKVLPLTNLTPYRKAKLAHTQSHVVMDLHIRLRKSLHVVLSYQGNSFP